MDRISSDHIYFEGHDLWALSAKGSAPFVLYAPTLRTALVVSERAYTQLRRREIPSKIAANLKQKQSHAITPAVPPQNAFHLGIGLTQDCTLSCIYCHADANKAIYADWATLKPALDHAFSAAAETPRRTLAVSFAVGGEPTLPWRQFIRTVNYLRDRERAERFGVAQVFLSMTTNGFYDDRKRTFIADNFDHLTVSCDGPPEIQDWQRPSRRGKPTYEVVSQSIRYFLSRRPRLHVGIRSTVSGQTVKQLPATVEFFAKEFGPGITVAFEPLAPLGRALMDESASSPTVESFTRSFLDARTRGRSLGVNVTSSGPSLSRLIARFCGAMAIPSFSVCVDGVITACHRDQDGKDYSYGQIDKMSGAIELCSEKRDEIRSRSDMPAGCSDCFAKWNCAGDCPDLRRIGWARCEFNRELLFDDLVQQMNL
ncbi:MAG: SPASM domain-containing protein [Burkholderiales bacterium]|nr:SPASM domain-containing protein [Burkholderiales bacterium]